MQEVLLLLQDVQRAKRLRGEGMETFFVKKTQLAALVTAIAVFSVFCCVERICLCEKYMKRFVQYL